MDKNISNMENVSGGSQKNHHSQENDNSQKLLLKLPTTTHVVRSAFTTLTSHNRNEVVQPTQAELRGNAPARMQQQISAQKMSIKEIRQDNSLYGALQNLCSVVPPQLTLLRESQVQILPMGLSGNYPRSESHTQMLPMGLSGSFPRAVSATNNTSLATRNVEDARNMNNTHSFKKPQTSTLDEKQNEQSVDEFGQYLEVLLQTVSLLKDNDDSDEKDPRLHVKGLEELRNKSSPRLKATKQQRDRLTPAPNLSDRIGAESSLTVRQFQKQPTRSFKEGSHTFKIPTVPAATLTSTTVSEPSTYSLTQMIDRVRNIKTPALSEEDRQRKEEYQNILQFQNALRRVTDSSGQSSSTESTLKRNVPVATSDTSSSRKADNVSEFYTKRNRDEDNSNTECSTDAGERGATFPHIQNAKKNRDDIGISSRSRPQLKAPGKSGKSIIKKAFTGLIDSITKKKSPNKCVVESKSEINVTDDGENSVSNASVLNETLDERRRREQRERKQRSRARQSEEQKRASRQSDAASRSRSRASETEEQRQQRLQVAAASQRQKIASETEEQRQQRLQVAAASQRQRIASETEEQRQQRLQVAAASQRQRIASETEEQRQQRLQVAAASQRQRIASETEEQRHQRLQVAAASQRQRIASETEEQRQQRLQVAAASQRQRIASETEEQRQQRLPVAAASQRQRIASETEEQRQRRLDAVALSHSLRLEQETSAETQRRLALVNAALIARRQSETPMQTQQRRQADADRHMDARSRESPDAAEARRRVAAERLAQMRAFDRLRSNILPNMSRIQQIDSPFFDETYVRKHSCGVMNEICEFCGSFNFKDERPSDKKFTNCCSKGKIILKRPVNDAGEPLEYPEFLKNLLSDTANPNYKNFRENIRSYNSSLSFASMGAKLVNPPGRGPYCFKVNGTIYHRTSHLDPAPGQTRQFAQLYVLDSTQAVDVRAAYPGNADCNPQVIRQIDDFFRANNRLTQTYAMMREIQEREAVAAQQANLPIPVVKMEMRRNRESDSRRFNLPTSNEVAMVFIDEDGEPPFQRDIRVYYKNPANPNQQFIHLNILSSNLDPMTYAILYPYGEAGWHPGFTQEGKRVSMLEYKVAQTAIRDSFNPIISAGKLTQQWIVDSYLQVEANDLNFIRTKQNKLRRELYQGLQDHINDLAREQGVQPGVPVILPSSFSGSPRNMRERLQDAMSIFAKYGPMDAFVTFTANPKWDEITANLKPGETASDRPDLVARVFKQKLKELIKDLTVNMVLGYTVAWVYTIEFQKRGLPHAHILLVFHEADKFKTSEKIDQIISAELPDQQQNPRLFEIVTRCMIHGPCGAANLNSPCMEDGKCTKRFPKAFRIETEPTVAGYPFYRRRRGPTATIGLNVVDNRWIVPYNPYLTLKYDCHINVEACTSLRAVKYIYKYIYKGFDCARVEIRQGDSPRVNVNEITNYIEGRYISAPEAMWRLLKNKMHDRSHAIIRLPVHLPNQQSITFEEGHEEEALDAARDKETKLTAYFTLNRQDASARNLLYTEIPHNYVFERSRWKQRERNLKIIPRMYTVSIRDEERFYLRVLLLHVRGATCFEDLRSVDGVQYTTFKDAAIQRHLLESDVEWEHCLDEAVAFQLPPQMRYTFAYICIFGEVGDPLSLWDKFKEHMIIDFLRNYDEPTSLNLALHDINSVFHQHGRSCSEFHLPEPTGTMADVPTMDQQQLLTEVNRLIGTLNPEQRHAFDRITEGVNNPAAQKLFYLNGPGGSGKTYLYRTLISYMHSRKLQVLPFASTGIAATLMDGGRTAHSGFGIPLNLDEASVSNIKPHTEKGRLLFGSNLIIIDEITMLNKHGLRVINELLQRVMNNQLLFGGKTVVVSGDFRQTLPVVKGATRAGIIEACIKKSSLWRNFVELSLISNMRSAGQNTYNNWILDIGIGNTPQILGLNADVVQIPNEMIVVESEDLIRSVFTNNILSLTEDELAERVILCTTNNNCLEINNKVIEELPGAIKIYNSADSVSSDDETAHMLYTTEFINSLQPSGLPPHELRLKKGAIVMLIRNLNPKKGLCNGTRLIVRETHENSIRCEIISAFCKGDIVLIPRINLSPSDTELPFTLKRRQFPVIPAFAVTINKSQGQTYAHIGILLFEPVFSHGQLYVALSRSRVTTNVKVFMTEGPRQGRLLNDNRYFTENIVYSEVFD